MGETTVFKTAVITLDHSAMKTDQDTEAVEVDSDPLTSSQRKLLQSALPPERELNIYAVHSM